MGHGSSSPEIENQGQGSRSLQKCVCYAIVYCGMLWVVVDGRHGTGSLGNQVIWVIFHVRVTGSSFWPGVRPEFFRFSKKCKTVKPLAHCKSLSHNYGTNIALPGTMQILLFDAGYKYSYLLTYFVDYSIRYKTEYSSSKNAICTPLHISRHLEFIIELGHRVNWVSGSLDSWVTKCDPVPSLLTAVVVGFDCDVISCNLVQRDIRRGEVACRYLEHSAQK